MDDVAFDVGEAVVASAVAVGQVFVVEAEEVEEGGVEVVDVDGVLDGLVAVVVGAAEGEAGLGTAAGHPEGEALGIVVASVGFPAVGGAAEFAAPDDERVVEETAGAEVVEECGDGAVNGAAVAAKGGFEVLVLVPSAMIDLDETDAGLGEAAREEALAGEGIGGGVTDAVAGERGRGFAFEFEEFGHLGLHAEGEFVGLDDALDLGVAIGGLEEVVVHLLDEVDLPALLGIGEETVLDVAEGSGGVVLAEGTDARALIDGGQEGAAEVLGSELERRRQGDEAGKVLVFGTEAVEDPGAHGRADELGRAGVKLDEGLGMIRDVGVHRTDEAQVVGVAGDVGEEFRDPEPGLAVLTELEGGADELGTATAGLTGLAGIALEQGFVVEGVEVGRAALHAQEDHALGAGSEVGRANAEGRGGAGLDGGLGRGAGGETGEGHPAESGGDALEELAAGPGAGLDATARVRGIHGRVHRSSEGWIRRWRRWRR